MKNVLVGQSGGPTAAINATLAGVVEMAMVSGKVDKIYGMHHGIKGVIEDAILDIGEPLSATDALIRLTHTPSSALGSCRYKLKSADEDPDTYKRIFEIFEKYNIGYVVYIGGNDSMDTVLKLSAYAKTIGSDVAIMGAPKTVDNDLNGMDHSPGFASAARYIATTISELWCDAKVYDIPSVTVVETMGRHVGWLCAASVLATKTSGAPHLIYLPEIAFDDAKFVEDVKEQMKKTPYVVVCVSEGVKRADGNYVSDDGTGVADAFGHKQLQGVANALRSILVNNIEGVKVRTVDFSLMQRSGAHVASPIDLQESRMLGATAMSRALDGVSGQVPVLNRIGENPYRVKYSTVPSDAIANLEKAVPREWINERGNFVTDDVIRYLEPLVGDSVTDHLYFY